MILSHSELITCPSEFKITICSEMDKGVRDEMIELTPCTKMLVKEESLCFPLEVHKYGESRMNIKDIPISELHRPSTINKV